MLERRARTQLHDAGPVSADDPRQEMSSGEPAAYDALTGLPGRAHFHGKVARLGEALQHDPDRRYGLLHLGVDRFRSINESLGHFAGDEVLKVLARRLSAHVRGEGWVARLSGDEFAILLSDVEERDACLQYAQRVLSVLEESIRIDGRDVRVSASVGIVICDPSYRTLDQVLRNSALALTGAKTLGRSRIEAFDETLVGNVTDLLAMEADLRMALRKNQFEPYFQPIRNLADKKVVGYEALIRWKHPTRGILRPAEFLKIAEYCKLIEDIDWQMFELSFESFLQHACDESFLTFNVSALHLKHGDFDAQLLALLDRVGLPASRVIVEITEGIILESRESVRGTLDRLRTAGVMAALDDFGTGYSSLRYLHELPIRILKIDGSFIQDLLNPGEVKNYAIVNAMLALGRSLGIDVVAEGIETQEQCAILIAMGCRLGQGYLLGHPAPAEVRRQPGLAGWEAFAQDAK